MKKSQITATIRTENVPVNWSTAKQKKHNIEMIETPEVWSFVKVNGVFTPYAVL